LVVVWQMSTRLSLVKNECFGRHHAPDHSAATPRRASKTGGGGGRARRTRGVGYDISIEFFAARSKNLALTLSPLACFTAAKSQLVQRGGASGSSRRCPSGRTADCRRVGSNRVWASPSGPSPVCRAASGISLSKPGAVPSPLHAVATLQTLRLLWRIVLRSGGPNTLQNQDCCGVAVAREERGAHRLTRSGAAT